MRSYLVVIMIILALMTGYVSLLPLAVWSDAHKGVSSSGPF
jgi:hypothetical protein